MRGGKLKYYKSFLCHKIYQKEEEKFVKADVWKLKKFFKLKIATCSFRKFLILEKKLKIISPSHDKIQETKSLHGWKINLSFSCSKWSWIQSSLQQPLLVYTSADMIIQKNMISGSKMLWSEQLCLIHTGLCLAMARSGSPCGKNALCLSQDVCQPMIKIKFCALFLLVWAGHQLC